MFLIWAFVHRNFFGKGHRFEYIISNLDVLGNAHRYPSLIFSIYDLFHEKRYKRFPRISIKNNCKKFHPSQFLANIHFKRTYLILQRTLTSTLLPFEELFFAFWHCKSEGLLVLDYPILVSTAKKKIFHIGK